jgi:hypothetical protein
VARAAGHRYRFGRSTERLSRDELKQLFLAFGGDVVAAQAEQELPVTAPEQPEQVADGAAADATLLPSEEKTKKKRVRVRSMKVAPNVERNIQVVAVPESERQCSICGREMKCFGHLDHEVVTFVPAKIVVNVERREKLGCDCRQDAVTAPRVNAPNVTRKVDATVLHDRPA